ncbi:hypothetical protein ElyMa_003884400 [Elysia marginata]|uniref:Uncharacterized protein n=1 Tax=Elysia marginata TaxID=1093978 RepID=A0AAV4FMB3_9GAST|nr:hypothetical protein ElyMa_003884400 [Elysia marginata]
MNNNNNNNNNSNNSSRSNNNITSTTINNNNDKKRANKSLSRSRAFCSNRFDLTVVTNSVNKSTLFPRYLTSAQESRVTNQSQEGA